MGRIAEASLGTIQTFLSGESLTLCFWSILKHQRCSLNYPSDRVVENQGLHAGFPNKVNLLGAEVETSHSHSHCE